MKEVSKKNNPTIEIKVEKEFKTFKEICFKIYTPKENYLYLSGFSTIRIKGKTLIICFIMIYDEFRKKGLGSELLKEIIKYGETSGCDKIKTYEVVKINNFVLNCSVKVFFEKKGFLYDNKKCSYIKKI